MTTIAQTAQPTSQPDDENEGQWALDKAYASISKGDQPAVRGAAVFQFDGFVPMFESLNGHGLTPAEKMLIGLVWRVQRSWRLKRLTMSVGEIVKHLELSDSTIRSSLKRLVQEHWLRDVTPGNNRKPDGTPLPNHYQLDNRALETITATFTATMVSTDL